MTAGKPTNLIAAVLIYGTVLLSAGAADTKHKWLKFFFDGVPDETTNRVKVVITPTANSPTSAEVEAAKPKPALVPDAPGVVHPPFAQNRCAECHEAGAGMRLRGKPPELCFNCHKDFLVNKQSKHQPVADGECADCHDPHRSEIKKLLLKKPNVICLDCHDDLAKKKVVHQPVGDGECLDCHNPHASDNKHLLAKKPTVICLDCHDDLAKKKVVHQPVSDGECLSCHVPHASNNKHLVAKVGATLCWDCHDNFLQGAKFTHDAVDDCFACHDPHQSGEHALLKKKPADLCLDCHEQKDLALVKGHANAGAKTCIDCHDPHVGKAKNLLKGAVKK